MKRAAGWSKAIITLCQTIAYCRVRTATSGFSILRSPTAISLIHIASSFPQGSFKTIETVNYCGAEPSSCFRWRRQTDDLFYCAPKSEQLCVASHRPVNLKTGWKTRRGQSGKNGQTWNAGVTSRIGIADHHIERRHEWPSVDRHLS